MKRQSALHTLQVEEGGLLACKTIDHFAIGWIIILIADGMDQNTTMLPNLPSMEGIEVRYVETHLYGVFGAWIGTIYACMGGLAHIIATRC